jgi:CBS domain-containing protein
MIQSILDHKGGRVVTALPTQTVKDAADMMREHGIAALVVKGGNTLKGVISERDIVNAISRSGAAALSMLVSEIASHDIVAVTPHDSLKRAMGLMTNHRVRHLPVMSDSRLVGIVSIGDVVKLRLEDLETESNVLRDVYIAAR